MRRVQREKERKVAQVVLWACVSRLRGSGTSRIGSRHALCRSPQGSQCYATFTVIDQRVLDGTFIAQPEMFNLPVRLSRADERRA